MFDLVVNFLFGSFPEAAIVTYVGLGLVGVQPPIKRLIAAAAVFGALVPVVRAALGVGPHVVITMVGLPIIVMLFTRVRWYAAVIGAALGVVILSLSEMIIYAPLALLSFPIQEVLEITWLRVLLAWVCLGPSVYLAYLIRKRGFHIFSLGAYETEGAYQTEAASDKGMVQ